MDNKTEQCLWHVGTVIDWNGTIYQVVHRDLTGEYALVCVTNGEVIDSSMENVDEIYRSCHDDEDKIYDNFAAYMKQVRSEIKDRYKGC